MNRREALSFSLWRLEGALFFFFLIGLKVLKKYIEEGKDSQKRKVASAFHLGSL